MVLEVVIGRRQVNRDKPMISINFKLKRVVISKSTLELMGKYYNKEFSHVLLLIDRNASNAFWIRPCDSGDEGSRNLNKTSGSTRTVSCSLLLDKLNWTVTKTETYPVSWDVPNNAAKVDLSQSDKGESK